MEQVIMCRNIKFDFLKGLLMFGVIWGHLITMFLNNEPNDIAIHLIMRTYDMPFFMLISGYFLAMGLTKKSLKQMLLDKTTTILLPTVFWSLFFSMFRAWDMFYFLWAVFYSSILLTCSQRIKNTLLRLITHLLIALVLNCIPYSLYNMSYLYPFFVMGYWFFSIWNQRSNRWAIVRKIGGGNIVVTCVFFLYVICLCFWKNDFSIWNIDGNILNGGIYKFAIITYRIIIGILGILVMKTLADVFFIYMQNHDIWFYKLMVRTGKETMMIYIFQNALIFQLGIKIISNLCSCIGYNPFTMNHDFMGYVLSPICAAAILFMMLKFIELIRRSPSISKIFGFKIILK